MKLTAGEVEDLIIYAFDHFAQKNKEDMTEEMATTWIDLNVENGVAYREDSYWGTYWSIKSTDGNPLRFTPIDPRNEE